jgi:hypothetical protein
MNWHAQAARGSPAERGRGGGRAGGGCEREAGSATHPHWGNSGNTEHRRPEGTYTDEGQEGGTKCEGTNGAARRHTPLETGGPGAVSSKLQTPT